MTNSKELLSNEAIIQNKGEAHTVPRLFFAGCDKLSSTYLAVWSIASLISQS